MSVYLRIAFAASVSLGLEGAEHLVLKTGFRLSAERIETRDASYVLHMAGGGEMEIRADQVDCVEKDDFVAPPSAVVAATQPAPVVTKPSSIRELVTRAALANGLPPEIVHSVARAESAYKPDAISHKGAIGVMQLMPGTAASLQADPYDPEQNIEAGARYLRELLIRYDGDSAKALAAYNAGPGAVDKYNGVPPYRETVSYVDKVLKTYSKLRATAPTASIAPPAPQK